MSSSSGVEIMCCELCTLRQVCTMMYEECMVVQHTPACLSQDCCVRHQLTPSLLQFGLQWNVTWGQVDRMPELEVQQFGNLNRGAAAGGRQLALGGLLECMKAFLSSVTRAETFR